MPLLKYHEMKNVYFIFIIFLSCASTNNGDKVLADFVKTKDLSSIKSPIQSAKLGKMADILIMDSTLIYSEVFNDYIFKLYNIKTGELLCESIKTGKGPNELLYGNLLMKLNDSIFVTYESGRNELVYISVNDLLHGVDKFEKIINFDTKVIRAYHVKDSLMLCTGQFVEGKYCLSNRKTKSNIYKLDYPSNSKNESVDNSIKALAYQGQICINPKANKFVNIISASGILEICSISENNIKRECQKIYSLPEYKIFHFGDETITGSSKNSKLAYLDVDVDNKYIYVLYSGMTREEIGEDLFGGRNLLVYDWEGNPIVNYKLDRLIASITLNKDNMKLYAYSVNPKNFKPEIVIYQLPKEI